MLLARTTKNNDTIKQCNNHEIVRKVNMRVITREEHDLSQGHAVGSRNGMRYKIEKWSKAEAALEELIDLPIG